MNITSGLSENYGMFSLLDNDDTKAIDVNIYLAQKYIENSVEPTVLSTSSSNSVVFAGVNETSDASVNDTVLN